MELAARPGSCRNCRRSWSWEQLQLQCDDDGSDVVISWGHLCTASNAKELIMIMPYLWHLSLPRSPLPFSLFAAAAAEHRSPALIMKKCIVFAAINGAIASLHSLSSSSFYCTLYSLLCSSSSSSPVTPPSFFGSALSSIHR